MSLFSALPEDALYLDRKDALNLLGTCSRHAIELDGFTWPSVEHYFHGMKFHQQTLKTRISQAPRPAAAARIARNNFLRQRRDWKAVCRTVMTRGMYTKCKAWPEVARALLDTGERMLVDNDLYDSYWGCGRDQQGHNYYGRILMNIREKLREEHQPD